MPFIPILLILPNEVCLKSMIERFWNMLSINPRNRWRDFKQFHIMGILNNFLFWSWNSEISHIPVFHRNYHHQGQNASQETRICHIYAHLNKGPHISLKWHYYKWNLIWPVKTPSLLSQNFLFRVFEEAHRGLYLPKHIDVHGHSFLLWDTLSGLKQFRSFDL